MKNSTKVKLKTFYDIPFWYYNFKEHYTVGCGWFIDDECMICGKSWEQFEEEGMPCKCHGKDGH
jgi:hypothetical protein